MLKGYGFLSFPKNIGKNIGKNTSKNLSSKYNQNLLDHAKQSTTDAFKITLQKIIKQTAEATGDSIGNKIADRITKDSKSSQQNNSETVINENDKKIPKERYISLKKRQKIIDNLRLI